MNDRADFERHYVSRVKYDEACVERDLLLKTRDLMETRIHELETDVNILKDELNSETETATALGAYLDQAHKDVEQLSTELAAMREREQVQADFLLAAIGARSLEHFAVRWQELCSYLAEANEILASSPNTNDYDWEKRRVEFVIKARGIPFVTEPPEGK